MPGFSHWGGCLIAPSSIVKTTQNLNGTTVFSEGLNKNKTPVRDPIENPESLSGWSFPLNQKEENGQMNWTTVRLLPTTMIIVLGLEMSQANHTAALVQSPVDKHPNRET